MRFLLIFMLVMVVGTKTAAAQSYGLYSDEKLTLESEYLGEPIELNLHIPETQPYAGSLTRYPITIIFDSQHERTYPQIIGGFDLLTSETQVPESIIIGVPFNIYNRKYLTSEQKIEGDELFGIEKTERFIFEELIPHIQDELNGGDFISLIGHSRTAFLVNYLAFKRSKEVNLAIALSGFYNDDPLTIDTFCEFLSDSDNFPSKFHYYYTAGTTLEDESYLKQCRKLDSILAHRTLPENVSAQFSETPNSNHMTNYWVSLPPLLIDAFSQYNSVLNSWFHKKLASENIENPIEEFKQDIADAGKDLKTVLNPNLTHIFSLASYFKNDRKTYETAVAFFELGIHYYPEYLDLYVEVIEVYKLYGASEKMEAYKTILREKVEKSVLLTDSEKEEYREYLESE
jgi:enterochelin esterase-like enzyme